MTRLIMEGQKQRVTASYLLHNTQNNQTIREKTASYKISLGWVSHGPSEYWIGRPSYVRGDQFVFWESLEIH